MCSDNIDESAPVVHTESERLGPFIRIRAFVLQCLWGTALCFAVFVLAGKIAVAFLNAYYSGPTHSLFCGAMIGVLGHVALIFGMLYLLFISEGMILAAIQLKVT
jgi:hypothetical protein